MIPSNNNGRFLLFSSKLLRSHKWELEGSHNNNLVSLIRNFVVLCEGSYHRRGIVADNNTFVKLNGFHVVLKLVNARWAWN